MARTGQHPTNRDGLLFKHQCEDKNVKFKPAQPLFYRVPQMKPYRRLDELARRSLLLCFNYNNTNDSLLNGQTSPSLSGC